MLKIRSDHQVFAVAITVLCVIHGTKHLGFRLIMRRARGRARRENLSPPPEGENPLPPPGRGSEESATMGAGLLERLVQGIRSGMSSELNYEKARKHGARVFTHASEPMEALSWLEETEKMFRIVNCPEERKVAIATQFLEREAWHWWLDVSRRVGDAAQQMSWEQFSAHFKERYVSRAHMNRMREEFLNLRKSDDMSVSAFEQRFRELAYYVPELVKTEQDKVYQFVRGLGGIYTTQMTAVPYASFMEAVIAALNLEAQQFSYGRLSDVGVAGSGSARRLLTRSSSVSSVGSGFDSSTGSGSGFRGRLKSFFKKTSRGFRRGSSSQSGPSGGQSAQQSQRPPQSFQQSQWSHGQCYQCGRQVISGEIVLS